MIMAFILGIIAFIFGIIVGSFLNVVALRYNTGRSLKGRSGCFSCGKKLRARELIPLLSWLLQGGRCTYCSCRISRYYLAGEFLTGGSFALVALRFLFNPGVEWMNLEYAIGTLFLWVIVFVLMVIFLYDLRHKIIPDRLSLSFGILAFVSLWFFEFNNGLFTFVGFHTDSFVDVMAGLLIPLPFVIIWLLSRGRLIGLGDPKLMVGIGFLLGMERGVTAVMISFWLGALVVLIYMVFLAIKNKTLSPGRRVDIMKIEIPFAPFLITSLLIVAISGINIFLLV